MIFIHKKNSFRNEKSEKTEQNLVKANFELSVKKVLMRMDSLPYDWQSLKALSKLENQVKSIQELIGIKESSNA